VVLEVAQEVVVEVAVLLVLDLQIPLLLQMAEGQQVQDGVLALPQIL